MDEDISGGASHGGQPDDVQYLCHVVKTIRGRETSTRAKLESQGWEFVSQSQGRLRTEMTFRRVKPRSLGAFLQKGWAAFRGLTPKTQRILLAAIGTLVLVLVVVGVVAAQGGGSAAPTAAPPAAPAEPSATTPGPPTVGPSEDPTTGPTETPTAEPSKKPSRTPSVEPSKTDDVLTAKNSKDLAAVLAVSDNCADKVLEFADTYQGRTIAFDGSISAMGNHGSYATRYDILVSPGNKGSESTRGPSFQFRDVNVSDLNLTGEVPDAVGIDDKLRVVAEVGEFVSDQCLLLLEPVSTRVR